MICSSLLRTLLWVTNFVLFAAGAFLIGAGIYVYTQMNDFLEFFDERYANGAILLGVCGVILFVLGFLGCCGASKENSCMLYTFAALLSVIVIAEVAGAIYVFAVNPAGSREEIEKKLNEAMENYGQGDEYDGVTITWNFAQYTLKCCGVDDDNDWTSSPYGKIPNSCYKNAQCDSLYRECSKGATGEKYTTGCLDKIEDFAKSNMSLVGGIGIGIALLQVLGVIIACKIPKEYQNV